MSKLKLDKSLEDEDRKKREEKLHDADRFTDTKSLKNAEDIKKILP